MAPSLRYEDYTIAWIASLPVSAEVALRMLDRRHEGHFESVRGDDYTYIGGEINGHQVIIATFPAGQNHSIGAVAALANQIKTRFPNIWFALLVGVATGLPRLNTPALDKQRDIRLGDVLVCLPDQSHTGVVQYDLGRDETEGFSPNGRQAETPSLVRAAIGEIRLIDKRAYRRGNRFAEDLTALQDADEGDTYICPIQERDRFFSTPATAEAVPELIARSPRGEEERTRVWYGKVGSGNSLIRNSKRRDELRDRYDLIGLDMEAAGVMNSLPTGIVQGVCDYGDAQENEEWQAYAAAVAGIYARGILYNILPRAHTSSRDPAAEQNRITRTTTLGLWSNNTSDPRAHISARDLNEARPSWTAFSHNQSQHHNAIQASPPARGLGESLPNPGAIGNRSTFVSHNPPRLLQ